MRHLATTDLTFPTTYDVVTDGPIDSREVVDTKADLVNKGTWLVNGYTYLWSGMKVSVKSEKALYMLVGDKRDWGFYYREEIGYVSSYDETTGKWTAVLSANAVRYSGSIESGWKRIDTSDIYVNNLGATGVSDGNSKQLFNGSTIDTKYLPSYVDDVVTVKVTVNEDGSLTVTAINEDETSKLALESIIYYDSTTGSSYRYTNGTYVLISALTSDEYIPSEDIQDTDYATNVGGMSGTYTKATLKNKSLSSLLDLIFFPEKDAYQGSVITYGVSNPSKTIEVGDSIPLATLTLSGSITNCGYIQKVDSNGTSYVEGTYLETTPTISDTLEYADLTEDEFEYYDTTREEESETYFEYQYRVTSVQALYTITSPTTGLSNGMLYNSRGSVSTTPPITGETKTINSVSAVIGTALLGRINNNAGAIWQKYDGSMASSVNGTYAKEFSIFIKLDSSSTADNLLTSYTFAIPVKADSVTYEVQFYDALLKKDFVKHEKLTAYANEASHHSVEDLASQNLYKSGTTTVLDTKGFLYSVNLSGSTDNAYGKYRVKVTIKFD